MMKAVSLFVAVVVMGGVVNAADPTEVDHEQFLPFGKSSSPLIFTTFANRTRVPGEYGLFLFGGLVTFLLLLFPHSQIHRFLFIFGWFGWNVPMLSFDVHGDGCFHRSSAECVQLSSTIELSNTCTPILIYSNTRR